MSIHPLIIVAVAVVAALYLVYCLVPGMQARGVLTLAMLGVIGYFLVVTVAEMPPFGAAGNPVFNELPRRYLEQGVAETGAVNIISSIIIDYRAFDTLGEATVLFVAIAAVIATLKAHK